MKLFERINAIAEQIAGSQARLAKAVRIPQGTLNGYLSEEGQRKIRLELLMSILVAYPQINRDWLYFGEGDMFGHGGEVHVSVTSDAYARRIAELEEELKEERRLNRRLTENLLEGSK